MQNIAPGTLIDGRYRVVDRIGSGGMADVYCATDTQLDRKVAVKLLMERPGFGRTEGFAGTRLPGDHAAGAIVPARVVAQDGEMLVAEAA